MTTSHSKPSWKSLFALTIGALGVVYGDIGTSPLYAVNEIMFGRAKLLLNSVNIIGAISLVIWALTIIVSFKYIIFVLRADSDGEGGVFALYSLLHKRSKKGIVIITTLLILAAGLLFGDGIITPAISVLSAVEGVNVATAALQPFIVPLTIVILTALFFIQSKGTTKVGKVFGPIIIVWFISIGFVGFLNIIGDLQILSAFNPLMAMQFLFHHSITTIFIVLGSVMLVVTGGEAMYADMGHFGRLPIRLSWFSIVYPALMLNYLGQGAFLLSGRTVISANVFYSMVPHIVLIPMVILATVATVIASQALISGSFSLMSQAITLGLFPYLKVVHTHQEHEGQIYIPFVNWILYVGCILLVIGFGSSSRLASAYGLAVSGVMFMTSLAMIAVARYYWKWSTFKTLLLFVPLALVDFTFLSANSLKLIEGGFIPLTIGLCIMALMVIWRWGRSKVSKTYHAVKTMSIEELIEKKNIATNFLPRSVVIMTPKTIKSKEDCIPPLKQVIWERYGILSKHIIFLTVVIEDTPHMHEERFHIYPLFEDDYRGSVTSVQVNFGFMEEANVEKVIEELAQKHLLHISDHHQDWIVEALHERIYPSPKASIFESIKFYIYQLLSRNALTADEYFGLGNDSQLSVEVIPVRF